MAEVAEDSMWAGIAAAARPEGVSTSGQPSLAIHTITRSPKRRPAEHALTPSG
jgi:hypothetical protein